MVKKQNNNVWIVYVIALIAIVALVLAIVAMNKVNMTGQGIFDFLKKQEVKEQTQTQQQNQIAVEDRGILGDAFIADGGDFEMLKGYEAIYDDQGNLIIEKMLDNGETIFLVGDNYEFVVDSVSGEAEIISSNPNYLGDGAQYVPHCTCPTNCGGEKCSFQYNSGTNRYSCGYSSGCPSTNGCTSNCIGGIAVLNTGSGGS